MRNRTSLETVSLLPIIERKRYYSDLVSLFFPPNFMWEAYGQRYTVHGPLVWIRTISRLGQG